MRFAASRVLRAMDQKHKTWAIRGGIGAGVCALLTAWMVPNTTPTAKPSVIAGMAGTAEAQKPTYSAVPDSAIPSWAGSLQQAPAAMPASAPSAPVQVADAGPMPPQAGWTSPPPDPAPHMDDAPPPDPAPRMDAAPPPPVVARADPPPVAPAEAPADGYQARRAAWQARLDTVMQAQRGPGGSG